MIQTLKMLKEQVVDVDPVWRSLNQRVKQVTSLLEIPQKIMKSRTEDRNEHHSCLQVQSSKWKLMKVTREEIITAKHLKLQDFQKMMVSFKNAFSLNKRK